jgi:hypothetical protein
MSNPAAQEYTQQQSSPGNPHEHTFTLASTAQPPTWPGSPQFRVHRPTRAEAGTIAAYRAARLAAAGYTNAAMSMVDMIDGRYIYIEAYVAHMLEDGPPQWFEPTAPEPRPAGAKPPRRNVSFESVYQEDLDAIWIPIAAYLRSFGIRLQIPDAPTTEV